MIVLYSNGSFGKNKKLLLMPSLQIKKNRSFFAFLEKVTCVSAEICPKGFTELPKMALVPKCSLLGFGGAT